MTAIARITLLSLVLGLSACAVHRPSAPTGPTIPPSGPSTHPSTKPSGPVTAPPKAPPSTSATFAPPPGAASHWDGKMQVYVLDEQGVAQLHPVTLGAEQGGDVEVLSGLSAGEKLVNEPGDRDLAGKRIEVKQ